MRTFIAILALVSLSFGQEIRRPTTDADAFGLCGGSHVASGGGNIVPNAYDSAGISTYSQMNQSASIGCNPTTCTAISQYRERIIGTWQTPSSAYTSLTLNVVSSSLGWQITGTGQTGAACVYYRTSPSGSWTQIRCDSGPGWPQTMDSITLSATQDLSKLQVGVCVQGNTVDGTTAPPPPAPGSDFLTLYDIWTSGGTTPAAAGNGSGSGMRHPPVIIH